LAIAPDDDQAWLNLGYCHERLDRPEEAVGAWRRAVAVNPDLVEARYSLVVARRSLGRPAEAAPHYWWLKRGDAQAAAELDSLPP
jgi:tetratricopeptide (TPR) repeat protein